jgi:hypothetical protein
VTVSNVVPIGVTVDVTKSADGRGAVQVTGPTTTNPGDVLLALVGRRAAVRMLP